ncbi:sulfotransferase [Novosphingobium sp. ERN07]|uniref:sulfotransferase n=1 Tax=Novosphingobium sp. ERN07 TaxID=2726187 RepID=UPI001456B8EB|nr:sulfotransferase [Novosphingobium sp. ERN07]NLR71194.1 sulfotransferase [Novosphingobium sp. ERN07]
MSIILLLSRQRSGTGALASVLERHPGIVYCGEVLDPTCEERSFRRWLTERGSTIDEAIDQPARFADFVDELKAESQINLIDIKYNCLASINPPFHSFLDVPWVLQILSMLPVPIVHLRRSPLETYISAKIAERSGTYHTTEIFSFSEVVNVDIPELKNYLEICYREDRFFEKFFAGYSFHAAFDYETMITSEGRVSAEVMADLERLLSLDLSAIDTKPRFAKQAPVSLAGKIGNLPEVTAWLGKCEAFAA